MKKILLILLIGLLILSGCSSVSPVGSSQNDSAVTQTSNDGQSSSNSNDYIDALETYKLNLEAAFDGYGIPFTLIWDDNTPVMKVDITDLSEIEVNNFAISTLFKDLEAPESIDEHLNLTYSLNDIQVKSYSISKDGEISYAMPSPLVIVGSNAYDIALSLENDGFPKHDISETKSGYILTASTATEMYRVETDKNHSIVEATFVTFDTLDSNGYIKAAATLPYDEADIETAIEFVTQNIGTSATITIGDSIFTLRPIAEGIELKIHAVGFEEYVEQCLDYEFQ